MPDTRCDPDPSANARYDLGILFVHGIGDQQQGATLQQFGEPIIETLRRWHMGQTGTGADVVRVTESVMLPARNFSTDPAHSVVEFDTGGTPTRWLLAEDWWGDQVAQPNAREFMTWMLTRGSWVVLLHLVERLIDNPRFSWLSRQIWWLLNSPLMPANVRADVDAAQQKNPRLVLGMRAVYGRLWVVAEWTIIALLVQIPLLLAFVVALIPIPSVSKWVATLVRRVASVLGDSFVLVKFESQRGAILTHFERSLAFVMNRCEAVAIVAHSQGTAVACEVLRRHVALHPQLLVTFGSGVAKLDQLYLAESSRRLSLTLAGFGPVLAVVALVLALPVTPLPLVVRVPLAVLTLVGWTALTVYVLWHIVESRADLHKHYARSSGTPLAGEWEDFNSTHDSVPTATLQQTFAMTSTQSPVSTWIRNRRSIIWDHTTYLSNFAEFVLPLCRSLSDKGGLSQPLPQSSANDAALRQHYWSMVVLHRWSYWVSLLVVPIMALAFQPVYERWGMMLWESAPWSLVPGWLTSAGAWLWSWMPVSIAGATTSMKIVSVAALTAVAMLLYRPVFGEVWEWWNLQAMESSVQYKRLLVGWRSWSQLAWLGFVAAIPTLALFLLIWLAH